MQSACLVQHLTPRSLLQARLGDTGAVSWQSALWAADSLPQWWLSPCHQQGYPRGDAQFGAQFWCPSLLWDQPHWHQPEAHCPGEAMAPFESNSSTPLIMAEGRNKTVCSPSQESVGVFAVFSVLLMIKKLQSLGLFLLLTSVCQ